jgi:glycosyltransferase involved in cell wall biosynthesis
MSKCITPRVSRPHITVVIPTYKRPQGLYRALASVTSDKSDDQEVIVIDDDPELSAVGVVAQFQGVRYFAKRGFEKGLSQSRNMGIQLARGDYILFLDDDDYLNPEALKTLRVAINSGKDFYYSDFHILRPTALQEAKLDKLNSDRLLIKNILPVGAYLIKASSIVTLFDITMKSHEDWQFLLANVDFSNSEYLPLATVVIDKTAEDNSSMQVRRSSFFWMEYLGVYARFPAPHLATDRQRALSKLGVHIPIEKLGLHDSF